MIDKLKYKTLILVQNLLELNQSKEVIKRIIRSLPLDILKVNLIQIFRRN